MYIERQSDRQTDRQTDWYTGRKKANGSADMDRHTDRD